MKEYHLWLSAVMKKNSLQNSIILMHKYVSFLRVNYATGNDIPTIVSTVFVVSNSAINSLVKYAAHIDGMRLESKSG